LSKNNYVTIQRPEHQAVSANGNVKQRQTSE